MRIFILVLFIFLASAGTGVAGDLPSHLAPFGNEGLGGLWVALARNGTGFEKPFGDTARICNVASTVPMVIASAPVANTSAPPPWSVSIAPGKCGCIPHPASLFAENTGATQDAFNGTYEWMSPKACQAAPTDASNIPSTPSVGLQKQAKCKALPNVGDFFTAMCEAKLPLFGKRHRLCFDENWVHVSAGNAYPTRFVQLVVDPKLLKAPGVQYDIRWSFLAKGCIDISNVHKVWFVIHGDANFSPKNVDRIEFALRAAQ